jgi:hypothetical protein
MKNSIITLLFSTFFTFLNAQTLDVDTILFNGRTDNRINLVILSDGYQQAELGKFITDAMTITSALFQTSPYAEYKNYFNVFAIKVPSQESGASHPGNADDENQAHPSNTVKTVNNYFGSTFDFAGIHRLLVPTENSKINSVLSTNFPSYDQVFILVNTDFYGGSGGIFATSSVEANSNEIAIHELGHSFANLADEYYAGDGFAAELANMTQVTDPAKVKWKNWGSDNGIGIYPHSGTAMAPSWNKPHQTCKMNILDNPFCSVCIEATTKTILALINQIDTKTPDVGSIFTSTFPMNFSVIPILPIPNTLKVKWLLQEQEIDSINYNISIESSDLEKGGNFLQVFVEDTTTLMRLNPGHTVRNISTRSWSIENYPVSVAFIDENQYSIQLFPNPATDFLAIEYIARKDQNLNAVLVDINGREVSKHNFQNSSSIQLNIQGLAKGTYLVNFYDGDIEIAQEKFIKQ